MKDAPKKFSLILKQITHHH